MGYVQTGYWRCDLQSWLSGFPNLLKRLQMPKLLEVMDLKADETVLDFGCGLGYITIEMAKLSRKAYGIDICENILNNRIPDSLKGRLEYIKVEGQATPFADNTFDCVLASEVLPMIPDPKLFLDEIFRILKPRGRLIVLNGCGHPDIEKSYKMGNIQKRIKGDELQMDLPATYEEYEKLLQSKFVTSQSHFFKEKEILEYLEQSRFKVGDVVYSPGQKVYSVFSWNQFNTLLKTGNPIALKFDLLRLYVLRMLDRSDKNRQSGGLIVRAEKA